VFTSGSRIPVSFKLTSVARPTEPVTDAKAKVAVQMVTDANGNASSKSMLEDSCEEQHGGVYTFEINTRKSGGDVRPDRSRERVRGTASGIHDYGAASPAASQNC
jgi:hypothetical protein